jgi:integral membrane sensor domain MASE1
LAERTFTRSRSSPFSWLGDACAPILAAAVYYLGAEAAFLIGTLSDQIFAPFWPPNILLFCALVATPRRRWPVMLAAVFLAHIIAELRVGMDFPQLTLAFATNAGLALFGAVAAEYLLGPPPWLANFEKAWRYVIIVVGLGPALLAFGGAFVPVAGEGVLSDYWFYWGQWFSGNALAALTLGPIFLSWYVDAEFSDLRRSTWDWAEGAIVAVLLAAACIIAMKWSVQTPAFLPALVYTPVPFVLWACVRFGARGASAAVLLVAAVLISSTLRGPSQFGTGQPETTVLALQLFLAAFSVPVLLLGAAVDQLRRSEQLTREFAGSVMKRHDDERRELAHELHERTAQDLAAATIMIAPPVADSLSNSPLAEKVTGVLENSISKLRHLSYGLHPPLLDDGGLALALRSYVEGLIRDGWDIDLQIGHDFARLPKDAEIALFRLVQESVQSTHRESDGRKPRIRIVLVSDAVAASLRVTVEADDKRAQVSAAAFRPSIDHERRLMGVRTRLRSVNGRIELALNNGAWLISATVPIVSEPSPTARTLSKREEIS